MMINYLKLLLSPAFPSDHCCQMAMARFLDCTYVFSPSSFWTMAPLRYAAPTPSTLVQSKEKKGSNFAIWQLCLRVVNVYHTFPNIASTRLVSIGGASTFALVGGDEME